ncbi:hypothetical protein [Homoserinibacter sp. YIM 151385]|uniref:hypothetical protein n=1 Tax=Homoserinibacter sp. YIM 151385 TaxID=2985506 RepID=UPI0022F06BD4|nr:hypothetical protein [Homoserinibacter sp. YIM 151385]WBU37304.1 hypothetical protein OF852_10305 [Homoserinibacter sp. YIM 151385]
MNDTTIPTDRRPLGFWIETIGPRLHAGTGRALRASGIRRREWRILTTLQRGPATFDELREALPGRGERRHPRGSGIGRRQRFGLAHRPARGHGLGHHPGLGFGHPGVVPGHPGMGPDAAHQHGGPRRHRSLGDLLAGLVTRGWVDASDGRYHLTEQGLAAHDAQHARISEFRASVREGIDDADWATTMATLERIAENLAAAEPDSDSDSEADRGHGGEPSRDGERPERGADPRGPWHERGGRTPHPRRPREER